MEIFDKLKDEKYRLSLDENIKIERNIKSIFQYIKQLARPLKELNKLNEYLNDYTKDDNIKGLLANNYLPIQP
jgi:hypothetical protein